VSPGRSAPPPSAPPSDATERDRYKDREANAKVAQHCVNDNRLEIRT